MFEALRQHAWHCDHFEKARCGKGVLNTPQSTQLPGGMPVGNQQKTERFESAVTVKTTPRDIAQPTARDCNSAATY